MLRHQEAVKEVAPGKAPESNYRDNNVQAGGLESGQRTHGESAGASMSVNKEKRKEKSEGVHCASGRGKAE